MLVLENTIFTFDQFPNNNVEGQEDTMDPTTLMNDYTQDPNPFSFVADKIDYDDYCPSPGIVDPLPPQNEENISPIRRHRFSICKATDPQCIINYRRLSNACSSIIPSPNNANSSSSAFGNSMLSASFPNTSFTTTPPLLFEDRKESRKIPIINENNEYESYPSPTLENSLFFNASRSYPNITCSGFDSSNSNNNNNSNYNNNNNNNNNFNFNNNNGSGLKPISSPFHTILTPNTFKAILTPDQIIDNVDSMNTNRDLDEQFRLFNYAEEDEDEEDFDDGSSYPSALNSNGQLNLDDDGGMVMLNKNLRFNSNNNIGYSEIVTSNSYDYGTNNSNSKEDIKFNNNSIKFSNNNLNQNEKKEKDDEYDDDNDEEEEEEEDDDDNGKISLEAIHERAELESRVIASIEKNRVEKQIKTYSQNIQGLYGLWKDNQGIGFKTLLRE